MSLENIKREFIQFMEEVHGGNPYPRNFYGCLLAIIIEPEPVSQERIMELTGFSQAAVSLTIKKIQLLFPIRTIKRVGERKHYYEYDDPNRFSLDLNLRRTEVQDLNTKFILPILEKAEVEIENDPASRRFADYLKNLLLYLNLTHEIRKENTEVFERVQNDGSLNTSGLLNKSLLNQKPLSNFLIQLKEASIEYAKIPFNEEQVSGVKQKLKNEYYTGVKSNFNPLYSQTIVNQFMITHTIIAEGCVTQQQIVHLTNLPRSTVSELLSEIQKRGVIKVTKKGSRVKFYEPGILFSDLMLGHFDRAANYIDTTRKRLSEFAKKTRKVGSSKKVKKLLEFLKSLERAYSIALALSHDMKVKMVMRLKEEYDQ
ncbi:MAG: hypothetical protein ACXAAQ_09270, partial [Candidatus Thorarchaeota archaeon]